MSSTFSILGDEFLNNDGEAVALSELQGEGKLIAIYFSAHWCPPCRSFTPQWAQTYKALKAAGKPVECIFISSDRSAGEFQSYFSEMPWLAVPHGDKRGAALKKRFNVQGIPALVLINGATGDVITADGRSCVMADPKGASMPFPRQVALMEVDAGPARVAPSIKETLDAKPTKKPSFVARLFRGNRAAATA